MPARDHNGNYVVIKFKADQADEKGIDQLQAYMEYLREYSYRNVGGILIASSYTSRAIYAARAIKDIKLAKYEVNLR
ncbi:MAG: hypothetical protein B6U85_00030 [Desulfurococcales archaeon ex4484_42]|nr:MAG: hypothetical protein B6U85_00030 [Desulfurococcales archaeon ex4484_42]